MTPRGGYTCDVVPDVVYDVVAVADPGITALTLDAFDAHPDLAADFVLDATGYVGTLSRSARHVKLRSCMRQTTSPW